ncbi:YjgF-like protein [Aspergillus ambiguus]|uniref:RidA family protein n=1 Tax=Aspergillus ambiguus TaxID=176160 RepID=UPI003CCDA12D
MFRTALRIPVVARLSQTRRTVQPNCRSAMLLPLQSARYQTTVSAVFTDKTHRPFAHYSQATKAAGQIWLSGQIPADAQGNLIKGSVAEKTQAIIRNTEAILHEAGSSLEKVVKVVVYVKDSIIMPEFSQVYDGAFPHKPARSLVEVSKLPADVDIQVDFVAVT